MLVELHNQSQDRFVYTCNECKHHVETRFHCTVCEVSGRMFVFIALLSKNVIVLKYNTMTFEMFLSYLTGLRPLHHMLQH